MGSRRTIELLLLGAAAPVVLLIFALVAGAQHGSLAASDFVAPVALLAAFAVAHVAVRYLAPGADPALLPIAALLSGIGLAFVGRLAPTLAGAQTAWIAIGVACMIATLAAVRSLERLARYKYTIMLAGVVLLLLPAVIGTEINGAKLWLHLFGFSFQPAEIAKILMVLFLGAYLSEFREVLSVSTRTVGRMHLPSARHLGPIVLMWLVSLIVLVAEKDLGSSLLFFGVFLVMVMVATGRWSYAFVGTVLFAIGATAAYFLFAHVRVRVDIWMSPFADAAGKGYQLVQSLFSLAAGGIIGVGPGRGSPTRIPFVATDFIFSAIGEELGLLGGVAIVSAYLIFCLRGIATAVRARSDMVSLTAAGLVATMGLQAFVIIGGVTRLIPLTGITLPFISYGGSSIVSNFILLALLMRAGDDAPAEGERAVPADDSGVLGRSALYRRLTGVAVLVSVLTGALVLNLTYVQVVDASALDNNPANTRNAAKQLQAERGAILTSDGTVLARSVKDASGTYTRVYPSGSLAAHVIGYYSLRYGRTGIEAAENDVLAAHRDYASFSDVLDDALGLPLTGDDVVLTIDSRVQKAAEQALAGPAGRVRGDRPAHRCRARDGVVAHLPAGRRRRSMGDAVEGHGGAARRPRHLQRLPAGIDLQDRDAHEGAGERRGGSGHRPLGAARSDHRRREGHELRGRGVRHRHAPRGHRELDQHGVRTARRADRAGGTRRPGAGVRLRQSRAVRAGRGALDHAGARSHDHVGDGVGRGRAAGGRLRGQGTGRDRAADGARGRRRRERRRRDAAVHRRAHDRSFGRGAELDSPAPVDDGHRSGDGRHRPVLDGRRREGGVRHAREHRWRHRCW